MNCTVHSDDKNKFDIHLGVDGKNETISSDVIQYITYNRDNHWLVIVFKNDSQIDYINQSFIIAYKSSLP